MENRSGAVTQGPGSDQSGLSESDKRRRARLAASGIEGHFVGVKDVEGKSADNGERSGDQKFGDADNGARRNSQLPPAEKARNPAEPHRGPGRPAGSQNKKGLGVGLNAENLARQIMGAHAMLAVAMKSPRLVINETESKMLADATIEVGKQYSVAIDPKVLALMNLAGASFAVYGPRIVAYAFQKKAAPNEARNAPETAQERAQAATRSGANVTVPATGVDLTQGTMKFG